MKATVSAAVMTVHLMMSSTRQTGLWLMLVLMSRVSKWITWNVQAGLIGGLRDAKCPQIGNGSASLTLLLTQGPRSCWLHPRNERPFPASRRTFPAFPAAWMQTGSHTLLQ